MQVEGIQVNADEGGVTQTRGGVYWLILPAGCNTLSPDNIISMMHPSSRAWSKAMKIEWLCHHQLKYI